MGFRVELATQSPSSFVLTWRDCVNQASRISHNVRELRSFLSPKLWGGSCRYRSQLSTKVVLSNPFTFAA